MELTFRPPPDARNGEAPNTPDERRMLHALQYRLDFERLVASLAAEFINLSVDEIDAGIDRALAEIGTFAGVDRSYVFLFSEDGQRASNTHEWCAEAIPSYKPQMQDLPCAAYPWWMEQMRKGRNIHVASLAELPPEAEAERALLEQQAVQSVIGVPLVSTGRVIGFLGFDAVRRRDTWTEESLALLTIVREMLANALERRRSDLEARHTLSLLRSTLESTADGILVVDREGRMVSFNRRFAELWRIPWSVLESRDDALALRHVLEQLKNPDDFLSKVRSLYSQPTADSFDVLEFEDGRVYERFSMPQWLDGAPVGRVWSFRDATERRLAEQALRASEARYRLLFERNLAGVFRNALDGRILDCNDACARMLGYASRQDLLERGAIAAYFEAGQRQAMLDRLHRHGTLTNLESCLRRKDGSPVWVLENVTLLREEGQEPVLEGTLIDITDRKRAEQQIVYQATHDALTGLPNRSYFRDRLVNALALARREGSRLAVLFLDLDAFKLVNDTLGHALGDRLLQAAADRLRAAVREGDTIARVGGDEFTVLLAQVTPEGTVAVAEKLLEAIALPFQVDGQQLFATTSIGVGLFPDDGQDADTLMKNADVAMYRAKEAGRNAYHLFTPELNARAHERLAAEHRLRHALAEGEFELYYQPQVNVRTSRVVAVEALLRWRREDHGVRDAVDFVPLAEESRVILPLGDWVLREACLQARRWLDQGLPGLRVAVNVSPRQFHQRNFAATVEAALEESGLPAHLLEIELTESAALQNAEAAALTLAGLRERGCRVAIDDFGTGYSSLIYLRRFSINAVKIDGSFVRDAPHDANDAAIVRAVISLCHSLNLDVVAEGVETDEQLAFLGAHGCELVQGYLLGRPVPAEKIPALFS